LAEDSVFIAQAITHRWQLHGGHGIEETGGQTSQPTVAQPGVRLLVPQVAPVEAVLLHGLIDHVFGAHIPESKWHSATITTLAGRIPKYIEKIAKRDPFKGKVTTGGIVTVKDSSWLCSWTVNRQPHFKKQPKDQIVCWFYSLFVDTPGDYVKKSMQECTG